MIGHIVGAYADGVRDARAAVRRTPGSRYTKATWCFYRLGWRDEVRRMAQRRQLAQLELFAEGGKRDADGSEPVSG